MRPRAGLQKLDVVRRARVARIKQHHPRLCFTCVAGGGYLDGVGAVGGVERILAVCVGVDGVAGCGVAVVAVQRCEIAVGIVDGNGGAYDGGSLTVLNDVKVSLHGHTPCGGGREESARWIRQRPRARQSDPEYTAPTRFVRRILLPDPAWQFCSRGWGASGRWLP